jgi:hypothetical protein
MRYALKKLHFSTAFLNELKQVFVTYLITKSTAEHVLV